MCINQIPVHSHVNGVIGLKKVHNLRNNLKTDMVCTRMTTYNANI